MTVETFDFNRFSRIHTEEHSSKGDQPKWYLGGKWYKADQMGYESLAEVVISHLLKKSNIADYVLYEPVIIKHSDNESVGCVSNNFKEHHEQIIPFERLHRVYNGIGLANALAKFPTAQEKIIYTVRFIEGIAGLKNVSQYITTILELDAFFLNEDRHTNNLAVIRDEETHTFRFCPIFDNGLALLSDIRDYPLSGDIYESINNVKAKPFDMSFDEQLIAAEQLYGCCVEFSFTKHDVNSIISEIRDIYDEHLLNRVESIIYEQMRKYPIYLKK